MFKAMQPKKKRPVDPNAPPRPNLMTHNVKIRNVEEALTNMEGQLQAAKLRIEQLEQKMRNQTSYIQALHDRVMKK